MQSVMSKQERSQQRATELAKKRRLRAMHTSQGAMCPRCWRAFELTKKQREALEDECEITLDCFPCKHRFEVHEPLTCQQRDEVAGVKFVAVDFVGLERPCTRHRWRLDWLGGSVGAGVPIVVLYPKPSRRRSEENITRYVAAVVEALREKVVGHFLYRSVTIRQVK